jgi:hypothetical protein
MGADVGRAAAARMPSRAQRLTSNDSRVHGGEPFEGNEDKTAPHWTLADVIACALVLSAPASAGTELRLTTDV